MKSDTRIGIALVLTLIFVVAFLLGREIVRQKNRVKNDTEKIEEYK